VSFASTFAAMRLDEGVPGSHILCTALTPHGSSPRCLNVT
jgi:hypothetical protein